MNNNNKNIIIRPSGLLCISVITVVELLVTGSMSNSGILWILYGIYKFILE